MVESLAAKNADAPTITLPWPPSVNHYWEPNTDKRGRFSGMRVGKAGIAYRRTVWLECMLQQAPRLGPHERISLRLDCCQVDRRRRDLDNVLKALLDSLQHAEVYSDDAQVDRLVVIRWHADDHDGAENLVRVTVETMGV